MTENLSARCCIAGGGPAGMMLGFLLARAGVDVVVLEKHADFLRDFRGDTIHPSTLEVIQELGLLDQLLTLPHEKVRQLNVQVGNTRLTLADFTHLPTRCGFIAFMPQWDFLDFVAEHARRYAAFRLSMETEVIGVIEEAGKIVGVRAKTSTGALEVRADLVVAADGRHSVVRDKTGLPVKEFGAPMDVLWFRLSRKPEDPAESMGRFETGRIFISINRGEYWQCGYVIAKGQFDEIRLQGLESFRKKVMQLAPVKGDRPGELNSWDEVKLLTVRVDRLTRWFRPGLLCIGDAAHAMSPVGGVGINLAIQDAVAAANALSEPLRKGRLTIDDLERVQKRREFPTRVTQWLQVVIQRRVIARVLGESKPFKPPLALRMINRIPPLRRIPARLIGLGIRPEHVKLAELGR
jgi:2-polyprenyl-6-methoxyphenol hydroxylase-like FAD-dependent oxidoreductase